MTSSTNFDLAVEGHWRRRQGWEGMPTKFSHYTASGYTCAEVFVYMVLISSYRNVLIHYLTLQELARRLSST